MLSLNYCLLVSVSKNKITSFYREKKNGKNFCIIENYTEWKLELIVNFSISVGKINRQLTFRFEFSTAIISRML